MKDELVTVLHNIKPTISKEKQDNLKIGAKIKKVEVHSLIDSEIDKNNQIILEDTRN
jgi:hypothetical protein